MEASSQLEMSGSHPNIKEEWMKSYRQTENKGRKMRTYIIR